MLISAEQYGTATVYDLLKAAALGQVGLDHRWLKAILDRGEQSLPDLLRFVREESDEDRLDLLSDVVAIARQLRTPAALSLLIEIARRNSGEFPEGLSEAFREIGQPSVEPLLELRKTLADTWEADSTLAALGVRDPRILDIFLEEFRRDPLDGAISLSLYGDPAAIPELERALTASSEPRERRELEMAIQTIRNNPGLFTPEPFDIWDLYPSETAPDFDLLPPEELVEFLSSPSPGYRAGAIRVLAFEEIPPDLKTKLLELARKDPDPEVRGSCWEALQQFAGEREIKEEMLRRLTDENVSLVERRGALVGLATKIENPAVRRQLEKFYDHPETRAAALKAMWQSGERTISEYFPPHLDDPDPEVRRQAVYGVGHLRLSSEAGRLRKLFMDENCREPALYSYALVVPLEISRKRIKDLFPEIERIAGGLSSSEAEMIMEALDHRLEMHGFKPVFSGGEHV